MDRKLLRSRSLIIGSVLMLSALLVHGNPIALDQSETAKIETRCGWLSNPTPANTWLYDRDGEWILGVQGGYQMQGDWDLPDFKPRQWVLTNVGSYGYGCACLQLRVNKGTHEVIEVKSGSARTLATCRRDRSLKKWKGTFK